MRVHHLNCGTFCPVGQRLINGRGGLLSPGRLVCHCLLVETGHGLILVDTGIGMADIREPQESLPSPLWQAVNHARLDPSETALHQVRALGFRPEDVRQIVLTHLDFDHAGGLADFPHAEVHVLGRELEAALHPRSRRDRRRYSPHQFAHQPRWVVHTIDGERWNGFEAVRALKEASPQVLLVPLYGHSRGHCGVAVERPGGGWFLHCGDAFFHHDEMAPGRRRCPLGLRIYQNIFQYDREARMRNQGRLRDLVRDARARRPGRERVSVLCSHDPDLLGHAA